MSNSKGIKNWPKEDRPREKCKAEIGTCPRKSCKGIKNWPKEDKPREKCKAEIGTCPRKSYVPGNRTVKTVPLWKWLLAEEGLPVGEAGAIGS